MNKSRSLGFELELETNVKANIFKSKNIFFVRYVLPPVRLPRAPFQRVALPFYNVKYARQDTYIHHLHKVKWKFFLGFFPLHFKIRKGDQFNIVYHICSIFLLSKGEGLCLPPTLFSILVRTISVSFEF